MTEETVPTKKLIAGAPWIMILAPKGAGKTRLAATLTDGFCFDTEPPGAASAWPDERRRAYNYEASMYQELAESVRNLKKAQRGERALVAGGLRMGGLVLDTFDMLQQVLISRYLQQKAVPGWVRKKMDAPGGFIWSPSMEQRDWGTILNYQKPLFNDLKSLNIPVVVVCHAKIEDPMYETRWEDGNEVTVCKKRGRRRPDIAGSIEEYIKNLCDYILNITVNEDGARMVYTQPTVVKDYEIVAADRHRLFKSNEHDWTSFPLTVGADGFPTRKVLDFICSNHAY